MTKKITITENKLKSLIIRAINESLSGDSYDDYDDYEHKSHSPEEMEQACQELLSLGVREFHPVTDNELNDVWSEEMNPNAVKQVITQFGMERLKRGKPTYYWTIEIGNRIFVSKHNFRNEDEAARNCDKYLAEVGGYNAYVYGLWYENGRYSSDIMLNNEDDYGWMD